MLIATFLSKFKSADNREMLTGSMFAMFFKVAGMLSGYIFIIVSIHYTSIEGYGVFSLCLALIQCAAILARLGFDSSIVKFVSIHSSAGNPGMTKSIYLKGLILISVAGAIFSVGVYLAAPFLAINIFHKADLIVPFQISALSIFPLVYLYYNAGALRGLRKIIQYSSLVNAHFISSTFVLVLIVFWLKPQYPLELSFGIGSLIVCGLSFHWWIRDSQFIDHAVVKHVSATELLSTSLPMLSAGALYIIYGWIDTFFLGIFSTQQSVGIFNVLLKIAAIIQTVLFAVTSISAPQFASLEGERNKEQLQRVVQKSTKLVVWATLPVVLIIGAGFIPFVELFDVGFEAEQYLMAFAFLCIGQVVNSFCGPASHLLLMTGYEKANGRIVFVSFVVSVVLNILLIPKYGLNGAAFSNMLGLIVRSVLFVWSTGRLLQINAIYNPFTDVIKLKKYVLRENG